MQSIVAANWKMHKTRAEARETARDLAALLGSGTPDDREVILFPPFTALDATREGLGTIPGVSLGGQNVYPAEQGAFTGEISPAMLQDAGCSWVLTGHSERRHVLHESPEFVGQKTAFALNSGLSVMLCIGETLEERRRGDLEHVLSRQLGTGLDGIQEAELGRLAIAYEPVWAIGTGEVASPGDIVAAHALTREILSYLLGSQGKTIPILYGGSVKADNASAILGLDNVSGLLVGGASLQAHSFVQIIRADLASA